MSERQTQTRMRTRTRMENPRSPSSLLAAHLWFVAIWGGLLHVYSVQCGLAGSLDPCRVSTLHFGETKGQRAEHEGETCDEDEYMDERES